jgi:2-polyprenyl-3-methyl-5-hydroxy-6-metoxy-1,4-benzoquinol methylase
VRDYSAHFFRWSFARRRIDENTAVLDVGCGTERPLAHVLIGGQRQHVKQYVGVDLQQLKPSKEQHTTLLGGFNFVERWCELKKLGPFDVIVCFEVIEHLHVKHGAALLQGCRELLAPNGQLLLSTPCYDGRRHAANHIHEYAVAELTALIKKSRLDVEDRFGTFMDVKHLKHLPVGVGSVVKALAEYFDDDALSCIFAPLFPDQARNNLWVCRRK